MEVFQPFYTTLYNPVVSINRPAKTSELLISGTIGSAAAWGLQNLMKDQAVGFLTDSVSHKFKLNSSENEKLNSAIDNTFKNLTNLKDEYKLYRTGAKEGNNALREVYESVLKESLENYDKKKLPKFLKNFLKNKTERIIRNIESVQTSGKYAFTNPLLKLIIVPHSSTQILGGFHEFGHAMKSKLPLKNLMFASRSLILPAIVYAAFSETKSLKQKKQSNLKTFNDNFKNNIGKIVFALTLPLLAEEARASINGAKAAKKVVSPVLYKKIIKFQAYGFSTYAIGCLVTALCARLAVYLSDSIQNKFKTERPEIS